jgi:ribosome-associated translation inhibitor RaiA
MSAMKYPVTLSFRRIERSGSLEDRARKLAQRLPRFCDRIDECRMVFEARDEPGGDSPAYAVKIDLAVPGAHIHADSLHVDGSGHRDIYLALRAAFNNAKRQLQGLPRRAAPVSGQIDSR